MWLSVIVNYNTIELAHGLTYEFTGLAKVKGSLFQKEICHEQLNR